MRFPFYINPAKYFFHKAYYRTGTILCQELFLVKKWFSLLDSIGSKRDLFEYKS